MALRPLVTLRVMLVPGVKGAERVPPTGTLSPAGVVRTLSPARPVAVIVSAPPQTFGTPPPPQVSGATQVPQVSVPPQPSGIAPQVAAWAAQVVGVQTQRGIGVGTQPVAGSHVSVVHGLPSLQLTAAPGTHAPALPTSGAVPALPPLRRATFPSPPPPPPPLPPPSLTRLPTTPARPLRGTRPWPARNPRPRCSRGRTARRGRARRCHRSARPSR